MHRHKLSVAGFTLLEFLVLILAITALSTAGLINVRNARAQSRDRTSKTDINTLTYYLESFYEKNGFYPPAADGATLKGIDPQVLKDRYGRTINTPDSTYRYIPHNCADGKCRSFDLQAELEKEALFTKKSLNT